MAKQTINIGTTANDGTGDPIRTAFDKVNDNFTELYNDDAGDVNSITATAPIERDSATGAVTISLADAGVTFAKMQDVAANSLLIRNANSSGVLSELALATTEIMIGDGTGMVAASLSAKVDITTYVGSVSFNWSAGTTFVMGGSLTGSFTINMSNYKQGQVITIHALTGSQTITLDTASGSSEVYNKVGGVDYDGSSNNVLQIECVDDGANPIFNYTVATYAAADQP